MNNSIQNCISQCLFAEDQQSLTEDDFEQLALDGLPSITLGREDTGLINTLVAGSLATSKTQARGFIDSGAVSINGRKEVDLNYALGEGDRRFDRYTLLRRGKKNHCLVIWA